MSYLLGLCFTFKRYRNNANMRIYADDHLVDEFLLDRDIKLRLIDKSKTAIYRAIHGPMNFTWVAFVPENILLFEINEAYLRKNIRIEVTNDNNNYTNGWISKHSYITWHDIFLIPDSLLDYKNWQPFLQKLEGETYDYSEPFPINKKALLYTFVVRHSSNAWDDDLFNHSRGGSFCIEIPVYEKNNIIRLGRYLPEEKIYYDYDPLNILSVYKQLNMKT